MSEQVPWEVPDTAGGGACSPAGGPLGDDPGRPGVVGGGWAGHAAGPDAGWAGHAAGPDGRAGVDEGWGALAGPALDTDGDGSPDTIVAADGDDLVVVTDLDGDGLPDRVLAIGRDALVRAVLPDASTHPGAAVFDAAVLGVEAGFDTV